MTLLVRPSGAGGSILDITPESAGWTYVGFEVLRLSGRAATRDTGDREVCVVVIEGTASISSEHGDWRDLGGRADPWAGMPDAVYLPPNTTFTVTGTAELGLCSAPAPNGGATARVLPGGEITVETRGEGTYERYVRPILMGDREAESLLVTEVLTPAGHWSSFPPHKHDRDDPPNETLLEETYYHRVKPATGFGIQRVYTDDRRLDETIAFNDADCVLVPRGYHTVSAPPGHDVYYLNVMAGPRRDWIFVNDPDFE